MSQSLALPENMPTDMGPPAPVVAVPSTPAPVNPLLKLHQCLRGRYVLAISLGVILGVAAAVAAHKLVRDPYMSTGTIRVAPYVPKILYSTDQNSVMPMFDAFVESQASMLQSQRNSELAMQSPTWQDGPAKTT